VTLLTPEELEWQLRELGAKRYHRLHPFHGLLHGGKCSKGQVQAWALNRYYYQAMIPLKDASLIARADDSALRRAWRERLIDHDGTGEGEGGIERWLRLTSALGGPRLRDLAEGLRWRHLLCAVDAYVHFVREDLLEAVASCLTELSRPIIGERMVGMLAGYDFITKDALAYFDKRPPQASRDADFALDYVRRNAKTRAEQDLVIGALAFNAMYYGRCWTR
jgi:coenzyme PQQ biosynthesis protein C